MFYGLRVTTIALLFSCISNFCSAENKVLAVTGPGYIPLYKELLAGRDPLSVRRFNFLPGQANRFVAEMVLLQQAVHLGGSDVQILFYPVSEQYDQYMAAITTGKMALSSECLPASSLTDYEKDLYLSSALIRNGEYEVALYTSPENIKALSAGPDTLSDLTAISDSSWTPDWLALKNLGLKQLIHSDSTRYMVKSVSRQRVDFMLAPFQLDSLNYHINGVTLVAIPDIKIVLRDSCRFAISKKHPFGEELLVALNAGIKELHRHGRIKQAYTELGIFNPAVKNWIVVYP